MRTKNKTGLSLFLIAAAFCLLLPAVAVAQVTGPCGDCHTMHGSQDGSAVTLSDQLLTDDCVGCHSNSVDGNTIVNNVPIVYNSVGGPTPGTMLAGGNFFWVASQDAYGHNVKGISGIDGALSIAPGALAGKGCAESCHESLVTDVTVVGTPFGGANKTGCQGCHLQIGHHSPADGSNGPGDAYRFLGGHGVVGIVPNGLAGAYEDDDWEQETTIKHNNYQAQQNANDAVNDMTVGRYCVGCHNEFHAFGNTDETLLGPAVDNQGDRDRDSTIGNSWLRHPTNVPIGGTLAGATEYGLIMGEPYSADIPLARDPLDMGGGLNQWDQVFCLSCHRAHGSEYPDILRFNYNSIVSHSGAGQTEGCFFCHRLKDDP